MKPEWRVALLGQGFMGKAHSNAYCQAEHFFDLPVTIRRTLLCGRNRELLEPMAARWGWEETTTDWREAIERKDIDAIDIALPNHLHAPVAIAAAQAGKMVLCEKPLALNAAEAESMATAASKVPTLVWFNYRRVPAIAYARQLIDEGRLGTIYHYRATYLQQWGPDLRRAASWRMDPAMAGSGVGGDLLTHSLDTALFLNGPLKELVSLRHTFIPGRSVDDAAIALVRFENGSLGSFEATRFATGCRNANRFEIHGAGGMLRFDLERLNHLQFFDASQPATEQGLREILVTDLAHPYGGNFWRPGHIIGYEHTFIATLADFLQSIASGGEFHPNFQDALAVQRALEAVEQSAVNRAWTSV